MATNQKLAQDLGWLDHEFELSVDISTDEGIDEAAKHVIAEIQTIAKNLRHQFATERDRQSTIEALGNVNPPQTVRMGVTVKRKGEKWKPQARAGNKKLVEAIRQDQIQEIAYAHQDSFPLPQVLTILTNHPNGCSMSKLARQIELRAGPAPRIDEAKGYLALNSHWCLGEDDERENISLIYLPDTLPLQENREMVCRYIYGSFRPKILASPRISNNAKAIVRVLTQHSNGSDWLRPRTISDILKGKQIQTTELEAYVVCEFLAEERSFGFHNDDVPNIQVNAWKNTMDHSEPEKRSWISPDAMFNSMHNKIKSLRTDNSRKHLMKTLEEEDPAYHISH